MTITIAGLGPGDADLITRAVWEAISNASDVYLRTRRHPTVPHLPQGPTLHDFDKIYDNAEDFEEVYAAIVKRLLAVVEQNGDALYAVPGDPMVGETSVSRLLAEARNRGLEVRILNGVSFVEPTLATLAGYEDDVDALNGLQVVDALDMAGAYHPPLNPDLPVLVAQVYGQRVASEVKLTLMNQYPDDQPVWLVHAASTPEAKVEAVPLFEMDRSPLLKHLTTLYVPPFASSNAAERSQYGPVYSFEGFQNTVAHLRAPDGCPWDREQTHQSLRPHLMEETYEVLAALDADDPDLLLEELGDLLFQVLIHAQVAVEAGEFHMGQVIAHIDAKLKRRHPHVWGDVQADTPDQVKVNWEKLKAEERENKGDGHRSLLEGVPKAQPALAQAHAYDSRAARLGFDWPDIDGVVAKLHEEIDEVKAASTPEEVAAEMGDLLFAVASWARWLKVEPETALREANRRFYARFTHVERAVRNQGKEMSEMSLEALDALWEAAKRATAPD
jgi:tetrapyrrole methylase family protein/MazG family protein